MSTDTATGPRRRILIAAICGTCLILTAVSVGLYGLLANPAADATPTATPTDTTPAPLTSPTPNAEGRLTALPDTTDPVRYARAAAEAIFTWDTTGPFTREDYLGVLLAEADPTGLESAGLASDLRSYLPTAEAWSQLRQYQTRQDLHITEAGVPESWEQVLADAGDQLRQGTTAVTIYAVRTRHGTWQGEQVSSEHEVAFTAFVACEPAFERCHLLRLSALDTPVR